MTRRDYIRIAAAVKRVRDDNAGYLDESIRLLIAELVIAIRADNPRFDEAKFLAACK